MMYDNCKECRSKCEHAGKDREFVCPGGVSCKVEGNTSVFTDILQALTGYSAAVDTGAASHDDFTKFQKLETRIAKAYQNGYYKDLEYRTLCSAYQSIKAGFRIVLGLDR